MAALASPEFLWLVEALLFALVGGLALALLVGALLLVRPPLLLAINQRLSRWIDTRSTFGLLEQPLMLERFFYRHHRLLGSLVTAGAIYVLWQWAFTYDREAFIALLDRRWLAAGLDFVVPALELALVVLHVLILFVGLIILLRPSLLKNVERVANRWHSGLPADSLDAVIGSVDRGISLYPRLSGLVVVAAAAWSLVVLTPVLVQLLGR